MRTASASSANGIAASTGPNTSSQREPAVHGGTSRSSVRRDVVAGRRRIGERSCPAPTIGDAVALGVGQEAAHAVELRRADQRPAVEVGERRPDAQRREALARAAPAPPRSATRSTSSRLPAEQVCPAFWTIALTMHRQRGVEVGIGEDDLRPLAAELQRHRAVPLAPPRRRPHAPVAGDPVNDDVLDARVRGQRRARLAPEAGDDVERAFGEARRRRPARRRAAATGTRPRPA